MVKTMYIDETLKFFIFFFHEYHLFFSHLMIFFKAITTLCFCVFKKQQQLRWRWFKFFGVSCIEFRWIVTYYQCYATIKKKKKKGNKANKNKKIFLIFFKLLFFPFFFRFVSSFFKVQNHIKIKREEKSNHNFIFDIWTKMSFLHSFYNFFYFFFYFSAFGFFLVLYGWE